MSSYISLINETTFTGTVNASEILFQGGVDFTNASPVIGLVDDVTLELFQNPITLLPDNLIRVKDSGITNVKIVSMDSSKLTGSISISGGQIHFALDLNPTITDTYDLGSIAKRIKRMYVKDITLNGSDLNTLLDGLYLAVQSLLTKTQNQTGSVGQTTFNGDLTVVNDISADNVISNGDVSSTTGGFIGTNIVVGEYANPTLIYSKTSGIQIAPVSGGFLNLVTAGVGGALALTSTHSTIDITAASNVNISALTFRPLVTSVMSCGDSTHRWSNVYANDFNIQGTSLNSILLSLVPYTGAATNVNLGAQNFTTTGQITGGNIRINNVANTINTSSGNLVLAPASGTTQINGNGFSIVGTQTLSLNASTNTFSCSSGGININVPGSNIINFNAAGGTFTSHGLYCATDNTSDLSSSGFNRFRNAYFGTSVNAPTIIASTTMSTPTLAASTSVTTPTINHASGVALQHNGSTKFVTTSSGASLTGTLLASVINHASGPALQYNGSTKLKADTAGIDVTGSLYVSGIIEGASTLSVGSNQITCGSIQCGIISPAVITLTNTLVTFPQAVTTGSNPLTCGNIRINNTANQIDTSSGNLSIIPAGNTTIGTTTNGRSVSINFGSTSGSDCLYVGGGQVQNRKLVLFDHVTNDHQFYGFGINPSVLRYQVTTSASHVFYAATGSSASAELMRISSNGRVGIGTSAPDQLLTVNSSTPSKITAGSWSAFSDRRIKTDITAWNLGLSKILQLNVKSFRYNEASGYPESEQDKTFVGLIAQEVEPVMPEMVTVHETPQFSDLRQLDITNLTYLLINAVKELHQQVQTMEHQIAVLNTRINDLT